jgi:hypothetical protein
MRTNVQMVGFIRRKNKPAVNFFASFGNRHHASWRGWGFYKPRCGAGSAIRPAAKVATGQEFGCPA